MVAGWNSWLDMLVLDNSPARCRSLNRPLSPTILPLKGIAHFLTGVALATCLPGVVTTARAGSLLPVLGGVGGLLPDILDFKFVRFFTRYDTEVDPLDDDGELDADLVVDALVRAMTEAHKTSSPHRVILHTHREGADLWRRYTLRIDPDARTVAVRIGPQVDTGQHPLPESAPAAAPWAMRQLPFPLVHTYAPTYHVDIFTGPSFLFTREGDALDISFLDWHHHWTHSLPLAVLVGLLVGLLCAILWGQHIGLLSGLVTGLGFAAHALEDQLGHMGCNLWWPLSHKRRPGLGLLHASDPAPNFLTVWTSLAVILLNLDRHGGPGHLPVGPYLALVIAAPWVLAAVIAWWRRRQPTDASVADETGSRSEAERLSEALDGDAA